eukprot:7184405-Prymnesium_polylepis.1
MHNNQVIDPEDFVRVLGRVNTEMKAEASESSAPGRRSSVSGNQVLITFEKAYALALAVLDDADITGSRTLDFFEYMNSMTGGTVDFKTYINRLKLPPDVDPEHKERMRRVWDEAQSEALGSDAVDRRQRKKGKRLEFRKQLEADPDTVKEMLRPEERMKKMEAYGRDRFRRMGGSQSNVTYGIKRSHFADVVAQVAAAQATSADEVGVTVQSSVGV